MSFPLTLGPVRLTLSLGFCPLLPMRLFASSARPLVLTRYWADASGTSPRNGTAATAAERIQRVGILRVMSAPLARSPGLRPVERGRQPFILSFDARAGHEFRRWRLPGFTWVRF